MQARNKQKNPIDELIEQEDGVNTAPAGTTNDGGWLDEDQFDGQLAVDVYETDDAIVVRSAVAGVQPEHLNITVNRDMVTIRGKRERIEPDDQHTFLFQECYWGNFSRTIILPVAVDSDNVKAAMKSGILTVHLPKLRGSSAKKISVDAEE